MLGLTVCRTCFLIGLLNSSYVHLNSTKCMLCDPKETLACNVKVMLAFESIGQHLYTVGYLDLSMHAD